LFEFFDRNHDGRFGLSDMFRPFTRMDQNKNFIIEPQELIIWIKLRIYAICRPFNKLNPVTKKGVITPIKPFTPAPKKTPKKVKSEPKKKATPKKEERKTDIKFESSKKKKCKITGSL